jgi:hypothetical protein
MSLAYGIKAICPSAAADKPHVFAHTTARSVANDMLVSVWNGATVAARKFGVDLLGKPWSAAYAAGDILYATAVGGFSDIRRMDSLAIGTAAQILRVNAGASAPEWFTLTAAAVGAGTFPAGAFVFAGAVSGITTLTATTVVAALTGNASGTAATVTGATQASITTCANLVTVGALNAGSITSGFGSIDIGADALTCGVVTISDGTSTTISTRKGANSDGSNIWVGAGGLSSVGEGGATGKGSYNATLGRNALEFSTTGYENTGVGYSALNKNTTGYYNVGVGVLSLKNNTTGCSNSALGRYALYDLVITADDGTGFNTAVGANTGRGIVTGTNNTILGANVTGLAAALSSNIILANGAGTIKAQHDGTNWTLSGAVTTSTPTGGTAGAWKLGVRVAATSTLDTTQYVQVDIGGTLYKVALVTT